MRNTTAVKDAILITDVGSTTTKAILIKKLGNEYRLITRGEAPTTVEAPFEDVRVGVRNAIRQVEELTGLQFLTPEGNIKKDSAIYLSTSSAGGGLQVLVMGLISRMTAESGERAALGAGAIVLDVMSIDDGRAIYEKIERMRHLRPDMVLLVGGTDGGEQRDVIISAETLASAKPRPRFGIDFKLPVIFAGNRDVRNNVRDVLSGEFALKLVQNVRPSLDKEIVEPARSAVHEHYLEHVMSHAPGYPELMKWTDAPILPTPAAVGMMIQTMAKRYNVNIIGTDPGGATTDIFSVFEGKFLRTVSANYGLSYSICNVMKDAGIENIKRWIPFDIDEQELRNELRNKMIRPTTIPPTFRSLIIEQAVNREAMRMAFQQHKSLATPLRGVVRKRRLEEAFSAEAVTESYIKMLQVDMLVGSGGPNAHAPRRSQTASMLIDAFQPEGITKILVDSIFMMPHCGVLAQISPDAALCVLEKDCLVRIGICIAPVGQAEEGEVALELSAKMPDGSTINRSVPYGSMDRIPLELGETAEVELNPHKNLDLGNGSGKVVTTKVDGGVVGMIIDARGRPLVLPRDEEERKRKLIEWYTAIDAYPQEALEG